MINSIFSRANESECDSCMSTSDTLAGNSHCQNNSKRAMKAKTTNSTSSDSNMIKHDPVNQHERTGTASPSTSRKMRITELDVEKLQLESSPRMTSNSLSKQILSENASRSYLLPINGTSPMTVTASVDVALKQIDKDAKSNRRVDSILVNSTQLGDRHGNSVSPFITLHDYHEMRRQGSFLSNMVGTNRATSKTQVSLECNKQTDLPSSLCSSTQNAALPSRHTNSNTGSNSNSGTDNAASKA
uniref:ATP synthase subunits region ORF 7 n=1 Tax=Lygus hesperus TaxID=30085 RepID=A0A0A9XNP2_LYGHE